MKPAITRHPGGKPSQLPADSVHALFFDICWIQRTLSLSRKLQALSAEQQKTVYQEFLKYLEQALIARVRQSIELFPFPFPSESQCAESPEARLISTPYTQLGIPGGEHRAVKETIHFIRFRETLAEAEANELRGNIAAHQRIAWTNEEFFEMAHRKSAVSNSFDYDLAHFSLLLCGLQLGLATLNSEQLADCFDAECPCKREHSPDALRKQRARMIKSLRYWMPNHSRLPPPCPYIGVRLSRDKDGVRFYRSEHDLADEAYRATGWAIFVIFPSLAWLVLCPAFKTQPAIRRE